MVCVYLSQRSGGGKRRQLCSGQIQSGVSAGNVPTPQLIGALGQQLRLFVGRMGELIPPFAHLVMRVEDAIHTAPGAQVDAFIEQLCIDLTRCSIRKSFAVEHVQDLCAFPLLQCT